MVGYVSKSCVEFDYWHIYSREEFIAQRVDMGVVNIHKLLGGTNKNIAVKHIRVSGKSVAYKYTGLNDQPTGWSNRNPSSGRTSRYAE